MALITVAELANKEHCWQRSIDFQQSAIVFYRFYSVHQDDVVRLPQAGDNFPGESGFGPKIVRGGVRVQGESGKKEEPPKTRIVIIAQMSHYENLKYVAVQTGDTPSPDCLGYYWDAGTDVNGENRYDRVDDSYYLYRNADDDRWLISGTSGDETDCYQGPSDGSIEGEYTATGTYSGSFYLGEFPGVFSYGYA